ncbi:MAG: MATE family efflux transporter [Bacteroidia bacterium]|nr:MATE family efflux transporter [Bacteroidia bacterium]NNM16255.1 MATE family efflux transporter [Bacteroidia bacterium]
MVLEMLMESLFAVVDIYFVGQLGAEAVATVGLTESILTIVYSLGFGAAMGATALVARRVGEKNILAANDVAAQAIILGLLVSVIVSIAGIFYSKELLQLMGAEPKIVNEMSGYMQWMLGGNFVIVLLFLLNGVFRGAGNASVAMHALWIANGLNIILDPCLILGLGPFPECGLVGAAYATNIGRACGVLFQLYILFNGKALIKVIWSQLKPHWSVIISLIKVSAGGTGQFIIASSSWIFLMRIMSEFGSDALAGYTIAIRIFIFTVLPAWGMANAAATLVGQNLGANRPDRAEKAVFLTLRNTLIFISGVSVIYFIYAEELIRIFTDDEDAVKNGILCLKYLSVSYILFAVEMVTIQAFNGAGDTRTPTILNIIFFWLMQIPISYFLALYFGLGPEGVYLGIIISESILALVALYLFKLGKWKTTKV